MDIKSVEEVEADDIRRWGGAGYEPFTLHVPIQWAMLGGCDQEQGEIKSPCRQRLSAPGCAISPSVPQRDFSIDNLQVRIYYSIVMIR